MNKINKLLAGLTKKKRVSSNKSRMKDKLQLISQKYKESLRDYYKQLYTNKQDKVKKKNKFL